MTPVTSAEFKRAIIALDRELVRRHGFVKFVELAWTHVPSQSTETFVGAWHIDEMCTHAEAMVPGSRLCPDPTAPPLLREIVVNIPPGHTKTVVWGVMLNAWIWTFRPEYRFMYASYAHGNVKKAAVDLRGLLRSPWYIERWGQVMDPTRSGSELDFWTRSGGNRFSTTIGGQATGRHFHGSFVDDPIKPVSDATVSSDLPQQVENANAWLQTVMASRRVNPATYVQGIIMQRLHESDPSGRAIEQGWTHLCLPALFEPERACRTPFGGDRRTIAGEVLNPARYSRATLDDMVAKSMGNWGGPIACAQLQQEPSPPGGLVFKTETFGHFKASDRPSRNAFTVLSLDCNFKANDISSDVGIAIVGLDNDLLVYDGSSQNLNFLQTVQIAGELVRKWGCKAIMVEDKANGPAVIEMLRAAHYTVIPVDPKTSKESRAHAANVLYQAGRALHNTEMTDLAGYESSLSKFPRGKKKDLVDALCQILLYLGSTNDAYRDAALAKLGTEMPRILQGLGGFDRHFSIR